MLVSNGARAQTILRGDCAGVDYRASVFRSDTGLSLWLRDSGERRRLDVPFAVGRWVGLTTSGLSAPLVAIYVGPEGGRWFREIDLRPDDEGRLEASSTAPESLGALAPQSVAIDEERQIVLLHDRERAAVLARPLGAAPGTPWVTVLEGEAGSPLAVTRGELTVRRHGAIAFWSRGAPAPGLEFVPGDDGGWQVRSPLDGYWTRPYVAVDGAVVGRGPVALRSDQAGDVQLVVGDAPPVTLATADGPGRHVVSLPTAPPIGSPCRFRIGETESEPAFAVERIGDDRSAGGFVVDAPDLDPTAFHPGSLTARIRTRCVIPADSTRTRLIVLVAIGDGPPALEELRGGAVLVPTIVRAIDVVRPPDGDVVLETRVPMRAGAVQAGQQLHAQCVLVGTDPDVVAASVIVGTVVRPAGVDPTARIDARYGAVLPDWVLRRESELSARWSPATTADSPGRTVFTRILGR